jgi:hypothetical protein
MTIIIAKPEGGDIKHAEAVAQALDLGTSHTVDPDDCIAQPHHVIISVGSPALKCLKKLFESQDLSRACIYWGAHQIVEADEATLKRLSSQIDVIAVAQEFNFISEGAHLIKMFGVPTVKLGTKQIKAAYDALDSNRAYDVGNKGYYEAIDLAKHYIIVSLPGDAPDERGVWQKFDQKSVDDLVQKTVALWNQAQDALVLVQNGPRTGKLAECELNSTLSRCTHTFLQDIDEAVDGTSEYFVAELKASSVPVQFYPYARFNNITVSAHNALIYTALQTGATFIVPGESTSQIKEMTQYINDPQRLLVFSPSSQNNGHKKTVDEAYRLGLVSVWGDDGAIQVPPAGSIGDSDLDSIRRLMSGCIYANGYDSYSKMVEDRGEL